MLNNHPLLKKLKHTFLDSIKSVCEFEFKSSKIDQVPKFKKVECYDMSDLKLKKQYKYTLEKEDPILVEIEEVKRVQLLNYINKTFYEYHSGTIYLDDHTLKIFRKVQNGLENYQNLEKSNLDFVVKDIKKSFTGGENNKYYSNENHEI